MISAFAAASQRYVLARTSWDENMFPTGGHAIEDRNDHDRLVESDWIMNASRIRALPQPGGYHCREALTHAIITGDPELLLSGFTDININVGHEQMLRSILKTYTHLPRERFTSVLETGLDTNLAIRQFRRDNESFFYGANPCQWHVKGRVTLQTDGQVFELVSGQRIEIDAQQLPVSLTPFGLAAHRVSSPKLTISGYQTEPMTGDELARLEGLVHRVSELLAHPEVKLSLSLADRRFMNDAVTQMRQAIDRHEYARAWTLITHHRFWTLWHDYLEATPVGRMYSSGIDTPVASPPANDIRYAPAQNCIHITDFPEDTPATMDAILAAVQNGPQYLKNCVFRDLRTAVAEGGSLSARLVRCTFEGNQSNWTLGSMQSGGIVLDDCTIGDQKTPLTIKKNDVAPEQAIRAGVPLYPVCLLRRSLQVKVVDAAGRPVPEALVIVSGLPGAPPVTRGAALTDQNGLTASDPETDAIVITTSKHQATDTPAQPSTETFAYEVAVTKPGFQSQTVRLAAGKPIPSPLVIELGR